MRFMKSKYVGKTFEQMLQLHAKTCFSSGMLDGEFKGTAMAIAMIGLEYLFRHGVN